MTGYGPQIDQTMTEYIQTGNDRVAFIPRIIPSLFAITKPPYGQQSGTAT